ncbi:MATE family efflux transporter [Clostridium ganghwense]|uniref:Probable multidrug resistance protein NorM n=1 Tax=Clostridium ganghwense TaxID=312089 RepID=A0ABT4CNT1_9CLOT|nr:MATE family efflux transporter [Clostridium ganghwense]MCY6370719.1 MATE family efflux transporter [Clostridium ganghwense]
MKDLTTGNEGQVILKFTIPILIGNIFQQLYNTIDSIIVGRFLGKNALASVSASFNIMLVILLVAIGLTLGTNILVAKYYGAKDIGNVKKAIDTAYIFTFVISILITLLGFLTSNSILLFFKVPSQIIPQSKIYLHILLIGTTSSFCYNTISSVLRGIGNSKAPLYFLILSTILNIILDLIFIIVFNFGVSGAALATIISQTFSFIGSFIYLNKIYPQFKFNIRNICFDKYIFKLSLKIGLPAALQKLLLAGGFIVIQILINGYGANSMAAFAAAGKLDSFAQIPAMNLGDALSTFTAQNLGANKHTRVKKGYISTLIIGSVISVFITIIINFFSKPLMYLFVTDTSVIKIGVSYLTIVSLCYIVYSAMVITNGVLIGTGNSFIPMLSTALSLWCVQIPISIFLTNKLGISGIWLGVPAGWLTGFALRLSYYIFGNWRTKNSHIKVKC